jgi:hypothetical protein
MAHLTEERGRWRFLNDFPGIHHSDFICASRNHTKVVSDKHHSHLSLDLLLAQKVENLMLNGDIQRRGRLIREEQLRGTCKCNRNAD